MPPSDLIPAHSAAGKGGRYDCVSSNLLTEIPWINGFLVTAGPIVKKRGPPNTTRIIHTMTHNTNTNTTAMIAALAVLSTLSATASAATLAISTFDTGDEGWISQRGPTGSPYTVNWNPTGGVPTGHINYWDHTSYDYEFFSASSSFLGSGDFSQAAGNGGVSFDWGTDMGSASQMLQIAFTSTYLGSTVLWTETPATIGPGWTNYDFAFDSTASWMIEINGAPVGAATSADISGVLAVVNGMFITADTVDGMDGNCWLDNPMIYSVPAPGAFALLGLAGIAGTRRRRR